MTLYQILISVAILIEFLLLWNINKLLKWRPNISIKNWYWRLLWAKMTFSLKWPSRTGAILAIALFAELFVQVGSSYANTPFTSFAFPGTGSPTSRTTPDRIGDIFNVKEYGAIGDGSHDDLPNIQAAITAASSNGIIFFPKGTYKVTAPILIPVGSSLILTGVGNGSNITGNFNGFIFDNLSNPSNEVSGISVIENLLIQNAYTGNNFPVTANGTWSASGSPVSITLSGANPGVAAGGALFINDARFSTNSVFVGMITNIASWPTVTVSTTAVASGATSNLVMNVVQNYSAGASWNGASQTPGTVSSYSYNSGTGLVTLTLSAPTSLSANNSITVSGLNIAGLNGTFTIASPVTSSTTVTYTVAGQAGSPSGGGIISWKGAAQITMATTPPAGISGQYYIYDYEDILADRKTNFNRGVATWSGTTLTFTAGSGVVGASIGTSDRLWLAPVAGCVRYSSVVGATVRDCNLAGFIGVTSSQDKIIDNIGVSQGFEITVERCNFGNPSGCSATPGQTGIYLTNNSLSYYNSFNSMWCAVRLSGTACSIIGGRAEVCYFGIIIHGDTTGSINSGALIIIDTFSMESNLLGLYVESGSFTINSIGAICNAINPIGGMFFNSASGVINNTVMNGNFGTGYAIYISDPGNARQNLKFISCSAVNLTTPSQSWRIPAQSWWGTCSQCDNPALVYNFANLTGVLTNPAAVEGDEYNINDGTNGLTWGQTATNTGTHTTHYKVRFNGTNWTVMGM